MNPNTWQELEREFVVEINGCWLEKYKSKSFVEQMIKKVFYYYDGSPKRPLERESWERAINSFCRNNLNQLTINNVSTKPKEYLPFVRPASRREGPDTVYAATKEKCGFCLDLQTIQVHAKDGTFSTLMLCDCVPLKEVSKWSLPKWDDALAGIFDKESCPVSWFKPIEVGGKYEDLWVIAKKWRTRVSEAEKWWSDQDSLGDCLHIGLNP